MPGSDRRRSSRGELIREREQARFVGRSAQLTLFEDNLAKDPHAEQDPADFLFHVCGVGGVGKSTLLRQWRDTAVRAGAVAAVVDENDGLGVLGVPQVLTELARQLAEQARPLKEFDRAAEQYRREQDAAAERGSADGGPSPSSRGMTQAGLAVAAHLPVASTVAAMVNPDAAAQGLDRLRAGTGARGSRRVRDADGLSRAFVAELARLCGVYPWVALFFDTWEQTGRYLDAWLRDLLQDVHGPLPANVIVVLAGRDKLGEQEWSRLRQHVADVPLEPFTEAETRALLDARGVTDPDAVEVVLQLSMGLPLLVDLLALSRPSGPGEVDRSGDAVDAAVARFVQWIADPRRRETVLACSLAPQLNQDVLAAAVPAEPAEARALWEWLRGQPYVSGHGEFKQYHAVVRASMMRRQRLDSPRDWAAAHTRLADFHAQWRDDAEQGLAEDRRWADAAWRRHHLAETRHRLCATPGIRMRVALEQTAHAAAEQDPGILRQLAGTLEEAARDTGDPDLARWTDRVRAALADSTPARACLTAVLAHDGLPPATRAWAHAYRGRQIHLAGHYEEALADLDRAVAHDPRNQRARMWRGEVHNWLGHTEQAIADETAALELGPPLAWAYAQRGAAHRLAGRCDQAVADQTAALELDPVLVWSRTERGVAHRQADRYDEAVADLTTALGLDPDDPWILAQRGAAYHGAGRHDDAVADLTAAFDLDPAFAAALAVRGAAQRDAGRHEEAVRDLTAALGLDPANAWTLAQRGAAYRMAGRHDDALEDLTAAVDLGLADAWTLAQRGAVHREAGRYEEAVEDLTAALVLDASDAWALAQRGVAHRGAGRYEEAVADLTAALVLDASDAWALAQRGVAHRGAGRFEEAVEDLTAALVLDPSDAWAMAQRGVTHRGAGRFDQAVADLTAALDRNPSDAWVLAQRGAAHRQAGRFDEAVADLTAALDLDPDRAWVLAERGVAHRGAGRFEEAVADLTAALDRNPSEAWRLAQRGAAHRDAGRYEEALADLTAALGLKPDDAWTLAERGSAYRLAGRHDPALADLTAAADREPALARAFIERGLLHQQACRYDQAVQDLSAAHELEPANVWTLAQRGVAHRQAGRHAPARADLERAVATEPGDPGLRFELLMLDTAVSGLPACAQRWAELLGTPVDVPRGNATRFFGLFRVLLLQPGADVAEPAEAFLSADPDHDAVTDLLLYLSELAAGTGEPADRARRLRRIITDRGHLDPAAG